MYCNCLLFFALYPRTCFLVLPHCLFFTFVTNRLIIIGTVKPCALSFTDPYCYLLFFPRVGLLPTSTSLVSVCGCGVFSHRLFSLIILGKLVVTFLLEFSSDMEDRKLQEPPPPPSTPPLLYQLLPVLYYLPHLPNLICWPHLPRQICLTYLDIFVLLNQIYFLHHCFAHLGICFLICQCLKKINCVLADYPPALARDPLTKKQTIDLLLQPRP